MSSVLKNTLLFVGRHKWVSIAIAVVGLTLALSAPFLVQHHKISRLEHFTDGHLDCEIQLQSILPEKLAQFTESLDFHGFDVVEVFSFRDARIPAGLFAFDHLSANTVIINCDVAEAEMRSLLNSPRLVNGVFIGDSAVQHLGNNLQNCDYLQMVTVSGSHVTDELIAELAALPMLTTLELYDSPHLSKAAFESIANIPWLQSLTLGNCKFEGANLSLLTRAKHLKGFVASHCEGAAESDFDWLPKITHLDFLQLSNTPLNRDVIQNISRCSQLRHVDLRSTDLNDDDLHQLAAGSRGNLESLRVCNNPQITEQGLRTICTRLTSLRYVDLRDCGFNNASAKRFQEEFPHVTFSF